MTEPYNQDDDAYGFEDEEPIAYFTTDSEQETPVEIVEAYFDKEELDYINESIDDILKAYEHFQWGYPPTREQLYRYLVGNAFYLRSDTAIEHCACWRVQIQPMDYAPHGFEILLAVGKDVEDNELE